MPPRTSPSFSRLAAPKNAPQVENRWADKTLVVTGGQPGASAGAGLAQQVQGQSTHIMAHLHPQRGSSS